MSYKIESIRKMITIANEYKTRFMSMDISDIKMCISKGNKKIGRVMNVSLMPVMTCSNCKECKFLCYDIKACLQYPDTVINARMRNTVLAMRDRAEYFNRIEKAIARRRKNKFFRWHVAGDIIDYSYFENMVQIAVNHPDFVFWTYTKNYAVVNQYVKDHGNSMDSAIPSNLHIMFSEWDGMTMVNPYNFPVFACRLKDGNKNRTDESFRAMHLCPGNCDICKNCGRGCVAGESSYVNEH